MQAVRKACDGANPGSWRKTLTVKNRQDPRAKPVAYRDAFKSTAWYYRSPFRRIERYRNEYEYSWTVDSIVGFYLSTSYCSEYVLADKKDPFEKDLRQALYEINPQGQFNETRIVDAIIAWKEPEKYS